MTPKKIIVISVSLFALNLLETVQATEFVYPSKGQSEEQQSKDKWECHQWATKQTGIDPEKMLQQTYDAKSTPVDEPVGLLKRLRARKQLKQKNAYISQQVAYQKSQLKIYDQASATCLTAKGYSVSGS